MASYHTVKQGEHLTRIAKAYGFSDYRTVWDHAENAEVKRKRGNPNVIFPGDRLFIPDKQEKEERRPVDRRHRFRVSRKNLKLRVVLEDFAEKPIADATCELQVDGQVEKKTTDAKGKMERDITPDAQNGILVLTHPQAVFADL